MIAMAILDEMTQKLHAVPTGKATKSIVREYAASTGATVSTLYRLARDRGWRSGKAVRTDAGIRKTGLSDDALDRIAAMKIMSRRKTGMITLKTNRAREIMEDAGTLGAEVSDSTLNRYLRERQLDEKKLRGNMRGHGPHSGTRAKGINHCHLFDVSVCLQWRFNTKKIVAVDEDLETSQNKVEQLRKRGELLHRYVLVDMASGCFFVQYFYAFGENTKDLIRFLYNAWTPKPQLPLAGYPEMVYTDKGSAIQSAAIKNLLRNLHIKSDAHEAGVPRATGGVETYMRIWQEDFESGLRMAPATGIEELNRMAFDRLVYYNATKVMRRHGQTRTDCYLKHAKNMALRLPSPEHIFYQLAHSTPETRIVNGDLTISYKGKTYEIQKSHLYNRSDLVGEKVEVQFSPINYPLVEIKNGDLIMEAEPVEYDEFGISMAKALIGEEYKSQAYSTTQKFIHQRAREMKEENALEKESQFVFGHHAAKLGNVRYIPPRGEEQAPEEAFRVEGFDVTGTRRMGPSPLRTRTWVIQKLMDEQILLPGLKGPGDRALVDGLMDGKAEIEEDAVLAYIRQAEEPMAMRKSA